VVLFFFFFVFLSTFGFEVYQIPHWVFESNKNGPICPWPLRRYKITHFVYCHLVKENARSFSYSIFFFLIISDLRKT
jgi:hypothetical protein